MSVNLAPLMDSFVSLIAAVASVCIPILTLKLYSLLHIKIDQTQKDKLDDALNNAIGGILATGQKAGDKVLSNVTIKNTAIAAAVQQVVTDEPVAVKALGKSDADIAKALGDKLAIALHEPSVSLPFVVSSPAETGAMLDKVQAPEPVVVKPLVISPPDAHAGFGQPQ